MVDLLRHQMDQVNSTCPPPLHRENPLGWGACEPVPSRSLRPIAGLDVQQRQILYATGRVVHAAAREAHPATHVGHGHRP